MQLIDRSGIACDLCGIQHKTDFAYYSFDYRSAQIMNGQRMPIDVILHNTIISSMDICPKCFEDIKSKVILNYSKTMGNKRVQRVQPLVCEYTGKKIIGTCEYYYCVVSKVDIKISNQPNMCTKCKNKTFDSDKLCTKCGNKDFVRAASQNVDKRFVDIVFSEEAYKDLRSTMERTIATAGQWSTKT